MERRGTLNEYEKLLIRMSTPRVVIDNAACANSTIVKVDSARKHEILLEAIQILADLNLCIKKAYVSSDGKWFMDVFHVTDQHGDKLADESVLSYIEQSLTTSSFPRSIGVEGLTALELTGSDRQGLLSEVFAVLSELQCNIVEAKMWTHNGRLASLIYVKDEDSDSAIEDLQRIKLIEGRLRSVLKRDDDIRSAMTTVSLAVTHAERRLHQLMLADHDYGRAPNGPAASCAPVVTVQNCSERGYSEVYVQSRDRPKLLFDLVCTLTDMDYVVFHATIHTDSTKAYQEFYIKHTDGSPICSDAEKLRLIQCLRAAIERRESEGVRLELCMPDRRGLLSNVTRTFRENGLSIRRAEVSTSSGVAQNVFYVNDSAGQAIEPETIEAVRQRIGMSNLQVKEQSHLQGPSTAREAAAGFFSLGSLVKRNLYNLGLIGSCS